jgi:hypothetical protein
MRSISFRYLKKSPDTATPPSFQPIEFVASPSAGLAQAK